MNEKLPADKFRIAAEEFAKNGEVRSAAKKAGVSEGTIHNWKKDKKFWQWVLFYRKLFARIAGLGWFKLYEKAKKKLDKLLDSKREDVILDTAKYILEYGNRLELELQELKEISGQAIGFEIKDEDFDNVSEPSNKEKSVSIDEILKEIPDEKVKLNIKKKYLQEKYPEQL